MFSCFATSAVLSACLDPNISVGSRYFFGLGEVQFGEKLTFLPVFITLSYNF